MRRYYSADGEGNLNDSSGDGDVSVDGHETDGGSWNTDRRSVLKATGAALGVAGGLSSGAAATLSGSGAAAAAESPELEKYVQPVPRLPEREPDGVHRGADYYEIPVREFTSQLHPDLPATTLWGFDGEFPGPIISAEQNERIFVEFDNDHLPGDHLFEVDERIHGTKPEDYPDYDGPVPEVRTVTHFHGLNIAPESDGQAEQWISPGNVTGPRFSRHIQDLPNQQGRMTSTYHDHALGISRLNAYAGLVGAYMIRGHEERRLNLPREEYDVPLVLTDRTFNEDGSLHYPEEFEANVAGDTALVNGAVWPYMEVEPRRYRLRFVNASNARTYNLQLEGESESAPTMHQFAAGHGFLEDVVQIGHGGDIEGLLIAPFERGEVIVDFSDYAGETFTVTNDAEFPFEGGEGHGDDMDDGHGDDGDDGDDGGHMDMGSGPPLEEVMQIRVADSVSGEPDTSVAPADLSLPRSYRVNEHAARTTRRMKLSMVQDDFGLNKHLLNDRDFEEETEIFPVLGSTEIWELENVSMHTHPIHLHLVSFDVIGRGPDGTEPPHPNETGKDTVRVNPDETVRIAVQFGDFEGQFPWHCHVLEHEDHAMMRPFEVVRQPTDESDDGNGDNGNGNGDNGNGNGDNGNGGNDHGDGDDDGDDGDDHGSIGHEHATRGGASYGRKRGFRGL